MTQKHIELELEDAAGNIFPLESPRRHSTSVSGLAMPPVRHWTTRSPFQHGRSHWGYAVQPRVVTLGMLLTACNRDEYWDRRIGNVGMFNPMNGPLTLRLHRWDRETYELHDGWYLGGYELSETDQDNPLHVQGASQIEFMDPFWKWTTAPLETGQTRDADGRVCMLDSVTDTSDELTIPFTGPFVLGTTIGTLTLNAYNNGTWATNPTISVTGPLSDWSLTNEQNGDQIIWNGYEIADEETVIVSIPDKSATNQDGDDLTTYVGGNIGSFELIPGDNELSFWAADLDNVSLYWLIPSVQICWFIQILGT